MFISNTDASTPRTFVTAANRVIPSMQYVRMSETLWHWHIFNSCKSFHQKSANRKLLLATCLRRQPGNDDVWVLSEDLQLRGDGQLIPEYQQKYFWHPHYRSAILILIVICTLTIIVTPVIQNRPTGDSVMPPTLLIERRLHMSARGFQKLCATAQECLSNNFLSLFVAVSGAVMGLHFKRVVRLNDECPIVMCCSSLCGTGKYYIERAVCIMRSL